MSTISLYTISIISRIARTVFGFMLLISAYLLPITVEWFASLNLMATYPLLTALVAWDPIHTAFEVLRQRFIDYHIFH